MMLTPSASRNRARPRFVKEWLSKLQGDTSHMRLVFLHFGKGVCKEILDRERDGPKGAAVERKERDLKARLK